MNYKIYLYSILVSLFLSGSAWSNWVVSPMVINLKNGITESTFKVVARKEEPSQYKVEVMKVVNSDSAAVSEIDATSELIVTNESGEKAKIIENNGNEKVKLNVKYVGPTPTQKEKFYIKVTRFPKEGYEKIKIATAYKIAIFVHPEEKKVEGTHKKAG